MAQNVRMRRRYPDAPRRQDKQPLRQFAITPGGSDEETFTSLLPHAQRQGARASDRFQLSPCRSSIVIGAPTSLMKMFAPHIRLECDDIDDGSRQLDKPAARYGLAGRVARGRRFPSTRTDDGLERRPWLDALTHSSLCHDAEKYANPSTAAIGARRAIPASIITSAARQPIRLLGSS